MPGLHRNLHALRRGAEDGLLKRPDTAGPRRRTGRGEDPHHRPRQRPEGRDRGIRRPRHGKRARQVAGDNRLRLQELPGDHRRREVRRVRDVRRRVPEERSRNGAGKSPGHQGAAGILFPLQALRTGVSCRRHRHRTSHPYRHRPEQIHLRGGERRFNARPDDHRESATLYPEIIRRPGRRDERDNGRGD